MTERGQAHTLEAVIAGLLLLSGLIFALQMTAVTPLSASTSSQHIENQLEASARGVLAAADQQNALKPAVLYWNTSSDQFYNVSDDTGTYNNDPPNITFGQMLNRTFDKEGVAYNVRLHYRAPDSPQQNSRMMIDRGVPTDNAVTASRTVTLLDTDHLYEGDGGINDTTLEEATGFYASDVGPVIYNVVRVEVIVWRI